MSQAIWDQITHQLQQEGHPDFDYEEKMRRYKLLDPAGAAAEEKANREMRGGIPERNWNPIPYDPIKHKPAYQSWMGPYDPSKHRPAAQAPSTQLPNGAINLPVQPQPVQTQPVQPQPLIGSINLPVQTQPVQTQATNAQSQAGFGNWFPVLSGSVAPQTPSTPDYSGLMTHPEAYGGLNNQSKNNNPLYNMRSSQPQSAQPSQGSYGAQQFRGMGGNQNGFWANTAMGNRYLD